MDIEQIRKKYSDVLRPISKSSPAGIDLRNDTTSSFYAAREARADAKDRERNAIRNGSADPFIADKEWKNVLAACAKSLCRDSKDLEVIAWLWEAMERVFGWEGFVAGCEIVGDFLDLFGEQAFPVVDESEGEEAYEQRLKGVISLCGCDTRSVLSAHLMMLPIVKGSDESFSLWKIQRTQKKISQLKAKGAKQDSSKLDEENLKAIRDAFSTTEKVAIRKVYALLGGAEDALTNLIPKIEKVVGSPLGKSDLLDLTGEAKGVVKHFAGAKLKEDELEAIAKVLGQKKSKDDSSADSNCKEHLTSVDLSGGQLDSVEMRRHHIVYLQEVAQFFRETEPHSPISYCIEQAVRWSEMSLPEVLQELNTDSDSRFYFKVRF